MGYRLKPLQSQDHIGHREALEKIWTAQATPTYELQQQGQITWQTLDARVNKLVWRARRGSNSRPIDSKSIALSN